MNVGLRLSWQYAHAVVPQPKRSITGTPCADVGFVEAHVNAASQEILFAVVSDGAAVSVIMPN